MTLDDLNNVELAVTCFNMHKCKYESLHFRHKFNKINFYDTLWYFFMILSFENEQPGPVLNIFCVSWNKNKCHEGLSNVTRVCKL